MTFLDLLSFAREMQAAGWYVNCRRNTRGSSGVWRGRWVRREGACIYINRSPDGGYEIRGSWWYGRRVFERAKSLGQVRALWVEIQADMARGGPAAPVPPAQLPEFEGQLDLLELLAVPS